MGIIILLFYLVLLVSIFLLLYYVFVPDKYGYSTAEAYKEMLLNKLQKFVAPDAHVLRMIEKTPEKVVRESLTAGFLFGLAGAILAVVIFREFNALVVLMTLVSFLVGIAVGRLGTDQVYKQWQGRLLEGVPTFVEFFPAFCEIGGITNTESLRLTLDFLPEPFRTEMWRVYDRIIRTGEVKEAFDIMAARSRHPYIDSICLRLSNAWNSKINPDIFDDLSDEIVYIKREAAQSRTIQNKASLALVAVIGSVALITLFGYPAWVYISSSFTGM